MTWEAWDSALVGLRHFIEIYGSMEFYFDVDMSDPGGGEGFLLGVGELGML